MGLILPWCNTAMMNLHLAAISADVAPGRHAVLLLDQAGWHLSGKLTVPNNPIQIADAALYLMRSQPKLGIQNPYALDLSLIHI